MTKGVHYRRFSWLASVAIVIQAVLLVQTSLSEPELVESKRELRTGGRLGPSNPAQPISPYLPRRLLTVFGLESSGTTFFTSLLEISTHTVQRPIPERKRIRARALNQTYEIQHISLPNGGYCDGTLTLMPVMYPSSCVQMTLGFGNPDPHARPVPKECFDFGFHASDLEIIFPLRFHVNITSHIQWYRALGVDATAIIVLRDSSIGSMARSLVHCNKTNHRIKEEQLGLQLIRDSLDALQPDFDVYASPPIVTVSYETLMTVGKPYLNSILQQINLPIITEHVDLKDGNPRYVQSFDVVVKLEEEKNRLISERRKQDLERRMKAAKMRLDAAKNRPLLPHSFIKTQGIGENST